MAGWTILAAFSGLALLLLTPDDARTEVLVDVAWIGCAGETTDGICFIDTRGPTKLGLAVKGAGENFTVQVDGIAAPVHIDEGGELDEHAWAEVTVEADGRLLEVVAGGRVVWSMRLAPLPEPPMVVKKAQGDAEANRWNAVYERLEPALPDLAGVARAQGLSLLRRAALRRGDPQRVIAQAHEAQALYEEAGWRSHSCDEAHVAFTIALGRIGDVRAAASELSMLADCALHIPRFAWISEYETALVAEQTGQEVVALLHYSRARAAAMRLREWGTALALSSAEYALADVLGREDIVAEVEWLQLLGDFEFAGEAPCDRAARHIIEGWERIRRFDRGGEVPDPRPQMYEALRAYEPSGRCAHRARADNARINLALAEVQRKKSAVAADLLRAVDVKGLAPEGRLWYHLAEFRGAQATGDDAGMARGVAGLMAFANREPAPQHLWHALVARGQLAEARGDQRGALASYRMAEELRDALMLSLAAGGSRERSLQEWDLSARRTIALQVELGEVAQAMCTARLARSRGLRAVEGFSLLDHATVRDLEDVWQELAKFQAEITADVRRDMRRVGGEQDQARRRRRDWSSAVRLTVSQFAEASRDATMSPACDDLREAAPGELLLVYYPISRERWLAFASDGKVVRYKQFAIREALMSGEMESTLLTPFDDMIERAEAVTFISAGELLHRELHTIPWRGDILLRQRTVSYGLDRLGPTGEARGAGALIVEGSRDDDLEHLFEETDLVEAALRWAGFASRVLAPADIDPATLLQEFLKVDTLHFEGHAGRIDGSDIGGDPSTIVLQLSAARWLGVDEILTMPHTPRSVFLSACSTGIVDPTVLGGGHGLPHAFIARGSEIVIAASDRVDDRTAALLAEYVYAYATDAAESGEVLLTPVALQSAQIALLDGADCGPERTECRYRAWVR